MGQKRGNLTLGHLWTKTRWIRDEEILPWVIQLGHAAPEIRKSYPGSYLNWDKLGQREGNYALGHLTTWTSLVRDSEILPLVISLLGQDGSETGKSYPWSSNWDMVHQRQWNLTLGSSNVDKVHQRQGNLTLGHISTGTRCVKRQLNLTLVHPTCTRCIRDRKILTWVISQLGQDGSETVKYYPGSSNWDKVHQRRGNLTLGHRTGTSWVRDREILPWVIRLGKAGPDTVKSNPGSSNWKKLHQRLGNFTLVYPTEKSWVRESEILPWEVQLGQAGSETGKSYPGSFLHWDKLGQRLGNFACHPTFNLILDSFKCDYYKFLNPFWFWHLLAIKIYILSIKG